MNTHDSPLPPALASMPRDRLLDSDPGKFRSLKRVIVIGRPGCGTDGVGDALKKLGFKVYDFQAASSRYERDFPLWLEAAALRQESQPYNKSDYDKVIGDHDAIVGAPACFFDEDLIKMYTNVKVILVTRQSSPKIAEKLRDKVKSRFWQWVDPLYSGYINRFVALDAQSNNCHCGNNYKVIRETVRERDLLEIHNLIAWVPLCDFLGVRVPDAPAPELHDNALKAELSARPQRWILGKTNKISHRIVMGLLSFFTMASITLVSTLAVFLGSIALFNLLSCSLQLFNLSLAHFQISDVNRLLAIGLVSCAFICGFITGYSLALRRNSGATAIESPLRDYQRKRRYDRRKGKQGRGRQTDNAENARHERPILEEWRGAQENIRKDDTNIKKEVGATLEEWKNEKQVTFHVTHKRTETGQDPSSGPRKVLSVTQETIQ